MKPLNELLVSSLGIDMVGLTTILLIGFALGIFARVLMPGRDPLGLVGTTVLGIVGAFVGSEIGRQLGMYGIQVPLHGNELLVRIAMSLIGAMVILVLLKVVRSA